MGRLLDPFNRTWAEALKNSISGLGRVLSALSCLSWAEDSLVKGYLVAQHKVGWFEILLKEVRKPPLLFLPSLPNPLLIREISLIVGMAVL